MQSKRPLKITSWLSRLSSTTTAALLLSNGGCAVQIADFQACSPIPGGFGAVCDNFLTKNPETLTQDQWNQLQSTWISQGEAVECVTSTSIGNIKKEIEKLCSETKCDYPTQSAIIEGLNKIEALGKK